MTITKSLTFTGNLYPIQFDVTVQSAAGNAPVPEILSTDKSDHTVPNPGAPFEGFLALVDNKIKREATVDASNGYEFSGDVAWAGFGYTYFFVRVDAGKWRRAQNFGAAKWRRVNRCRERTGGRPTAIVCSSDPKNSNS